MIKLHASAREDLILADCLDDREITIFRNHPVEQRSATYGPEIIHAAVFLCAENVSYVNPARPMHTPCIERGA